MSLLATSPSGITTILTRTTIRVIADETTTSTQAMVGAARWANGGEPVRQISVSRERLGTNVTRDFRRVQMI